MGPELNRIYQGDHYGKEAPAVLKEWPENFIDAVVCDPPYELGFMGKKWDSSGIAYSVEMWRDVLRVMKPGAHLLAFGGTRTYHRMACAIEDAGFEIRDQIQWLYGSGFPKSLDISKAIDKAAGATRKVVGKYQPPGMEKPWNLKNAKDERLVDVFASSRNNLDITAPATPDAEKWEGWGTALKPANEPICLARKPLSEPTVAANVLRWRTGALNIDAARIEANDEQLQEKYDSVQKAGPRENSIYGKDSRDRAGAQPNESGRWPANVLFDQYAAGVLDGKAPDASRFFYVAKPDGEERNMGLEGTGNVHATVKPVSIMSYLIQLVAPPKGIVLDHFAGSGTTGIAAANLGHPFLGVEKDPAYINIANKRISAEAGQGKLL